MNSYDVVVIGAGNGGLTSAVSLAQKGLKVLLLERHNIPGGCATSFCRGRFEFEVALHQLSGLGTPDKPGPLRSYLHGLEVVDELEWVAMENLYRIVLPGKLDLTLPAEKDALISVLQARFPHEKESIVQFFDMLYNFFYQVIQGFFMRDPEISKEKYPLYFKYALKNTQEILDEYFTDPLLKLALSPYWAYMGIPTSHLAFVDYAALMFQYIEYKPFHLKGGSQALSNSLLARFIQHGGEVRFNCAAKKIMVENGRVTGVITADDDTIACERVVSNASSVVTYTELIDAEKVPEKQFEIMSGSTIGTSAFTMYIGLDCEAKDLGIDESTIFFYESADPDQQAAAVKNLDMSQDPFLLSCYNLVDPEASPPGTCQIAIVDMAYADPWLQVPPAEYQQMKYNCADIILNRVEGLFPGFRDHIEEIDIATPVTHMRYLGTPGGAFYGFDQYAKDSNLFIPPRAPIQGLFLAGAWAGAGGFQPTLMSGGAAARAVLRDMKK